MAGKGHALARDELIRVLTAYTGVTTDNGNIGGTTLIDANLKDNPSISARAIPEKTILIMSGDAIMEDKGAASFDNATGTITLQGTGFSVQIKAGTTFRILNISSVEIDVDNINTKIGTNVDAAGTTTLFAWMAKIFASADVAAIETKLDKLAGSEADTEVANKDLAAGPTEIFTISTTTRKKVHMLMVSMVNCTAAAKITVDLSTKINGVLTKFYSQKFTKDTDPDGIMVINGTLAILSDLKVEMTSDAGGDTAVTVPYSYILEDME